MAAASAILFALRPRIVVVPAVSYLGVRALLGDLSDIGALRTVEVDITDVDAVESAVARAIDEVGSERVLLWIETPSNPTLDIADVARLSSIARARGVRTAVDSTFATPLGGRPIELGADVVLHAGTKFIGGHSDLLIGLVGAVDAAILDALRHSRVVQGATPGALESFLALRGLRTLHLRYDAASKSAVDLAARLAQHPAVDWVRQVGPMVSFIVRGGAEVADRVCSATALIVPATSLGGVETTMERRQKYAGDSHVNPGLIRMSVGIEDPVDLWADLEHALASASGR
jgi:cystathionine gamma-synthase